MKLGLFHFQLLHQILERIHFLYDEDELANAVLQSISLALNAEGGTIFLLHPDKTLVPLAAYGVSLEKLKKLTFESGRGVVGWVVQHAQPVKVDRPSQDQRFGGGIDVLTGFKTQSILAAPITAKGDVVGVIEFLNRKDGPFTSPDLELVSMVGREVGIAFENVRLIRDLKRTQALLDATTASLTAGMLIVDQASHLMKLNPSGVRILELVGKESDWNGQNISKFLSPYPPFVGAVEEAIAAAGPLQRRELKINTKRGERLIGYSGMPVMDSAGTRLGTALLFQDITDFVKTRS